jgi:hypothetical protein
MDSTCIVLPLHQQHQDTLLERDDAHAAHAW